MGLLRFIAARFSQSARPNSASDDPRHKLGVRGEKLAEKHLRKTGYKILYRNFRPKGGGEVDLVCRDGKILAFVEVKTRASDAFGRPADAVTTDKRELIARGARAWMRLLDQPDTVIRFDVVEVIASEPTAKITVTKAAFVPKNTRA
jgi:putative endonuclease